MKSLSNTTTPLYQRWLPVAELRIVTTASGSKRDVQTALRQLSENDFQCLYHYIVCEYLPADTAAEQRIRSLTDHLPHALTQDRQRLKSFLREVAQARHTTVLQKHRVLSRNILPRLILMVLTLSCFLSAITNVITDQNPTLIATEILISDR